VGLRVVDDTLIFDADPAWAEAINTDSVTKGVRVNEMCRVRGVLRTSGGFYLELAASPVNFRHGLAVPTERKGTSCPRRDLPRYSQRRRTGSRKERP
jgi:hypothetical protein